MRRDEKIKRCVVGEYYGVCLLMVRVQIIFLFKLNEDDSGAQC